MSQIFATSVSYTPQQRYFVLALINALTVLVIVVMFTATGIDVPTEDECAERIVDFHAVWGAARLALTGEIITAFDREVLEQAYFACDSVKALFWLYPAPMAIALTPIGTLPFLPAYIGFQLVSLVLLAVAAHPYLRKDMAALIAVVFAPAWLPALLVGQFTILWCVGLLAAISAMREERHVLAGIFIGLLTLKPTLGLLIPIILLADRRYLTIVAATTTTAILHMGATALYGFDYFTRWVEASSAHGVSMTTGLAEGHAMTSVAAFVTHFGLPAEWGIYVNIGLLVAMVVTVFAVWRKHGARSDVACAVLCAAIPLSTPYLWHYDAGFLALVALFVYRAAAKDLGPLSWPILGVIWAGPGITIWNLYFFHIPGIQPSNTVPLILLLALAFALFQLRQKRIITKA